MLEQPVNGGSAPAEALAPVPSGSVRVSDADREVMVGYLRAQCGEGRLTLEEFADRVGEVYQARTKAELVLTGRELPSVPFSEPDPAPSSYPPGWPESMGGETPATRPVVRPAVGAAATSWHVGIMSGHDTKSRWRPGAEVNAVAIMGGVELDFRNAVFDHPEVIVTAVAIMGGVAVIVPEGVEVTLDGLAIMGGKTMKVADTPTIPGSPRIVVKALAIWGGVDVKSKPPKRPRRQKVLPDPDEIADRADEIAAAIRSKANDVVQRKLDRVADRAERHARQIERHAGRHAEAAARWGEPLSTPPPGPPAPPRPPLPTYSGAYSSPATPAPAARRDITDGTVTIMFSDIEGSTLLAERLGDHRWLEVLRTHNDIVRGQVAHYSGEEVKAQGDGFMVAFSSARRALLCAISVQRELETFRRANPEPGVQVRIGLHTGEVIRENGDLFGKNVILAARIAGRASGGQILASSLVKELTESGGDLYFVDGLDVELKGLTEPYRVWTVDWRDV